MSVGSMASGWYYSKRSGAAEPRIGPFTWEQLYSLAQTGVLAPDDLVWNPQLPQWTPATQIPGLFPAGWVPAPAVMHPQASLQPEPYAPAPVGAPVGAPGAPRRSSLLWAVLIPVIALIVVGGGLGAYFGFIWDRGNGGAAGVDNGTTVTSAAAGTGTTAATGDGVSLGVAETRLPDLAKLIQSEQYGEVPADHLVVVLAEGAGAEDADRVAQAVGGSVVGRIEYINLYQIQFPGATEADLQAAIDTARADASVEAAGPYDQVYSDIEIWGVRQSALNDPAYQGSYGKGYELVGVDKAWKYIKGSGMHLWGVNVGVVDSGIYTPSGEFEGDVNVTYPEIGNGTLTSPTKGKTDTGAVYDSPDGSHGTAVAGIIGADGENGGQAGIASILGNKLTLTVSDQYASPYGNKEVPADPNDPTVVTYPSGKSWALGAMKAIITQVESGAKVINCSWGNAADKESPTVAAAYRKFFEKMSRDHPDVLFVCSAGNDGKARDGSQRYPSGLNLPNMITVGNIMNDGTTAPSSNKMNDAPGQEYEVTLAAPGDEAVRSVGPDGQVRAGWTEVAPNWGISGGTSMAAPHVSAAAALLLSINPNLSAGQIKDLLTQTARPGPPELGGKTLAIDAAVLEVINQQREKQGLTRVTAEELENGAVVDAVAISIDGEPNTYTVKAILKVLPSVEGADVVITGTAGIEIDGETTQHLDQAGEAVWSKVYIPGDSASITVTRQDSGASSVITFEKFDLNGIWNGTFTITDIQMDEAAAQSASEQGCDFSFIEALKGQAMPARMDISVDEAGNGTAVMILDASAIDVGEGGDVSARPLNMTVSYAGNTVTFTLTEGGAGSWAMSGTVARNGTALVMEGSAAAGQEGLTMTAVWTVTKED